MYRDNRRHGFFIVDNAVIDQYAEQVGVYGLAVYNLLLRLAGAKGECFPAHETLATRLGISRQTVAKAITELESAGLVTVTERVDASGRKTSNLYTINDVGKPAEEPAPVLPEGLPLYQRTIAQLATGTDRQKLSVLAQVWRDIFGTGITFPQLQELVNLAGGHTQLVKAAYSAALSVPDIQNAYALVKGSLQRRRGWQKQQPAYQPKPVVAAREGLDRYEGVDFE